VIRPLPFRPDRFASAAAHCEQGRPAYAPALVRRIAAACGLAAAHPHHGPDWVRHEAVLPGSPFGRLERFGVIERREVEVGTMLARALSMSGTSPQRLGGRAGDMVAELRALLEPLAGQGGLAEVVESCALVAWRD
jgi:hypothetical protein